MAALVLFCTFSASGVIFADQAAQISGTVSDAAGLPLPAATVTLRREDSRDQVVDAGADGRFVFEGLSAGEYRLTATVTGFGSVEQAGRLLAGQHATVSLTLEVRFLESTVVTATKSGAVDAQRLPIAVTVLQGRDLERMNDRTVEHLADRTPGVTFSQNTGLAQVTIRGIGTNAVFAGSDPSSAVYLDGVYLARPAMVLANLLEIDRVEVFRGPQGTLYGRNSLGGAINLITKAPTNETEASVRVTGGNQRTFRTEARLSGALLPGRLMASAAILRAVRTGFVRDRNHPDNPLGGDDDIAARGQLRLVLNPRSELHVAADFSHSEPAPLYYAKILATKPGFNVDNPADFHEVRASFPAEGRTVQSGVSARFSIELTPTIQLTSLSAFRQLDFDVQIDSDVSELDQAVSHVHEIQHQMSQEVIVASTTPRVTWVAGVFLFGESDRQPSSIYARSLRIESRLDPQVEAGAAATFGQVTLELAPRVAATAGLRYTRERKTIDNAGGLYAIDPPHAFVSGAYRYNDTIRHTALTPKVALEVRAHEHVLAYGSATRGFKSGGFNATSTEAGRGFAPEWAWSYEGGVKTTTRGGRTTVNLAAFHTDYTDLQVQTAIRPGVFDISNAASATIRGVELEAANRLGGNVTAGGYIAWLNARYDEYRALRPGGVSDDVAGHRLNNSPEWSARAWVDWTTDVGSAGSVSLRADSRWKSTVFFSPFNDNIERQRPVALLDVSVEFGPRQRRWSIAMFARNLTNEDYITGSAATPPPAVGGRPGDSRQAGVQFTVAR